VLPGEDTPLFVPWLYGERVPMSMREGRGALLAASLRTTRADLAYAVLAGIALNARWAYAHAQRLVSASPAPLRITGGGARSAVWRQIVADVLGKPLEIVEAPEHAGARGAAMTAAVASGWFATLESAAAMARCAGTVEPNPARAGWADSRYAQLVEHAKRVKREKEHR
jgi:xylulokinase